LPILYPVEKVAEKGLLDLYLLNQLQRIWVMFQRALMPPPVVYNALESGFLLLKRLGSTLHCLLGKHFGSYCRLYSLFEKNKWQIGERL
jgi:hypothetical protein